METKTEGERRRRRSGRTKHAHKVNIATSVGGTGSEAEGGLDGHSQVSPSHTSTLVAGFRMGLTGARNLFRSAILSAWEGGRMQ